MPPFGRLRRRNEVGIILLTVKGSRAVETQSNFAGYGLNYEVQGPDTIVYFVIGQRIQARDCDFKQKDNMIRDRIVSPIVRKNLINDKLSMDEIRPFKWSKTLTFVKNSLIHQL